MALNATQLSSARCIPFHKTSNNRNVKLPEKSRLASTSYRSVSMMSRGCGAGGGGGGERLFAVGIMMKQLKQATTKLFRKQRSGRRVVLLTTKATNGSGQMLVVDALVDEQHKTEQGRRQQQQFVVSRGHPSPLGASRTDKGINFALYSEHATAVSLCL
jgi:hypothetical protein